MPDARRRSSSCPLPPVGEVALAGLSRRRPGRQGDRRGAADLADEKPWPAGHHASEPQASQPPDRYGATIWKPYQLLMRSTPRYPQRA